MAQFEDIKATGPQDYRDLQDLNSLEEEYPLSFDTPIKGLRNTGRIVSLYDPYANAELEFQTLLFNPNRVTSPDYWGASKFDKPVVNEYEMLHLLDVRANNQRTLLKLGAGIGKAVTTGATTFVDGTLGLIYGLGSAAMSAITEDKPWQLDLAKIFDNDLSNGLQRINDAMEEVLPNYRTELEELNAWYQNMGTANFWADFIKQIGFTVGAFYSGGAWLKALKFIKGAGAAGLAGSFMGAVNEGRIEANINSNDWYNLERAKLEDAYKPLIQNIVNSQDRMISDPSDPEGLNYISEKELKLLLLKDNYNNELQDLELRKAKMGLVDLAINVPLLTATNMFQFGKMYKRGFDSSRTMMGSSNFYHRVKQGFKEAVKGESKVPIANVIKNAATEAYEFTPTSFGKAALRGAEHFLSEGSEEMNQMWGAELAGTMYQYDSPDAYYRALTDPDSIQKTKGFIKGITEGFANSWGDINKYQDFVMGGLTGLLGTPTFGRVLNSSRETYLGRGKIIGLTGGIGGEISRANYENQIGLAATDEMNAYLQKYGKPFTDRARHHVASNYFTDLMNGASATGDAFEYHNMADNEEFNAIDAFALTGHLDDYKQLVRQDFENISDEDLEFISNATVNTQTGKPLYTQSDGITKINRDSSEEDKLEMRESLIKKRDSMLKSIDQYEKSLASMRSISGITENDDAVRELAWLDWKIKRFADRSQELVSENKDDIQTIVNILRENNTILRDNVQILQDELQNDDISEDRARENKAIIATYTALQAENEVFSKVLEGWMSNKYLALNEYGKQILLSDDFYNDYVHNSGLSYAEFTNLALNMLDIDRITAIKEQFDDRLKYYLDNSLPIRKPSRKNRTQSRTRTTNTSTTSTSIPQQPAFQSFSMRQALLAEQVELRESETTGQPTLTLTQQGQPAQPALILTQSQQTLTELKIQNDHDATDEQIAERVVVGQSKELRAKIESITTPSQLLNLLEADDTDIIGVRAILKDIEALNPNHPVVIANKLNKFVDKVYNAMHTDALGDANAAVYYMVRNLADLVSSVEELKRAALDENNLAEIIGYRTPELLNPKYVEDMTKFKLALSDILNKITEDTNTASTLASDNVPVIRDSNTTGSDQTSVDNENSLPSTNTPTEDALSFVIRSKTSNMSNNQIIEAGIKLGFLRLDLLNAINTIDTTVKKTEEAAAIKTEYTSELLDSVGDATVELEVFSLEFLDDKPTGSTHDYFRSNTTSHPIHSINEEFETWLDRQNYSDLLKQSLRVRHKYLSDNGAFARVDKGEVKEGLPVAFKVIKAANEEALDFTVFITDNKGNIIGDLPTNTTNYSGLQELLNDIEDKYKQAGEPDTYTYPIQSHIALVLTGSLLFTDTSLPIGQINPNLHLGVVTGLKIQTSTSGNNNPVVSTNEIKRPLHPKRGLVYVLVPNDRLGSDRGYTPVLCTVPKFGPKISGTIIRDKIVEQLGTIASAKDFPTLFKAFTKLLDYLWVPDIIINAFNGNNILDSNSKAPITLIVIKRRRNINDSNSPLDTIIKLNPNDSNNLSSLMTVLLGTPLHINLKFLNTPEGREMYNQVVMTNLPVGTETTVNNWFTINRIVDGQEVPATKIKSTGINPNEHKSTNQVFDIDGHKLELDSKNYKVWVDGVEQTPLPITDPRHITTKTNTYLAQAFVNNNPTANKVDDAILTPYGWYDVKQGKLVLEPEVEQPAVSFTRFTLLLAESTEPSTSSGQQTDVSKLIATNPDVIGQIIIDGEVIDVLLSDLENAILYGLADDSIFDATLAEQALIIKLYKEQYRLADTITSKDYKKFNKDEELKWLERVLPQLTFNERKQLIKGLIDNRAWGKFMNGIIYLSDEAAEGTTYHEAFHVVSQTLLTDKERDRMYKAAREVYGNKSIYDLEELLAEDFRKKIQTNILPDNKLRRFFNKLALFVKSIFDNKAKLDKLFYDINQGTYADRVQKIKDGYSYRLSDPYTILLLINKLKNDYVRALSYVDSIRYTDRSTVDEIIADEQLGQVLYSYQLANNGLWSIAIISLEKYNRELENLQNKLLSSYNKELSLDDILSNLALLDLENSYRLIDNLDDTTKTDRLQLSYDVLDSNTKELLNARDITEDSWNEMSVAEKENAKECAGV